MKKIAFALALALAATGLFAQSTGSTTPAKQGAVAQKAVVKKADGQAVAAGQHAPAVKTATQPSSNQIAAVTGNDKPKATAGTKDAKTTNSKMASAGVAKKKHHRRHKMKTKTPENGENAKTDQVKANKH